MCVCPVRKVTENGIVQYFNCGHCYQCLKAYQDQWSARLAEECKAWKPVWQEGHLIPPVVFFTCKYRNDSIPCKYLCLSSLGWFVSREKPSCEVLEHWTDTRRESRMKWRVRKASNLDRWKAAWRKACSSFEEVSSRFDLTPVWSDDESKVIRYVHTRFGSRPKFGSGTFDTPVLRLLELVGFTGDNLPEVLSGMRDLPEAVPFFALEFHSVSKADVQSWLKRSRRRFERYLNVQSGSVSTRQCTTWTDPEGEVWPLPDSCLTKTFKYFITSEYGPRTHRPHYHGVLFGVTYEEFERFFATDWVDNFGSIDYSAYDSTRGGMTYLSKYCSKGGYEHPYCRKDFFFPGGEFHSRRYEDSLKDFGVDVALVDPTFHLISKGVGARYAFQPEIQRYFGVRLAQFLTDSGKVRYMCTDDPDSYASGHTPSLPVTELFVAQPGETGELESLAFSLKIDVQDDGSLRVSKWTLDDERRPKYPISVSVIPLSGIVDATVEVLLLNQKYNRRYAKRSSPFRRPDGRSYNVPRWHFVHTFGADLPSIKTQSISLPRYYRQFLVSPLASALRQAAARRSHSPLDQEIKRAVFDKGLRDALGPRYEPLVVAQSLRYQDGYARFRQRSNRDYAPCGAYEID